jgi:hypothetical protein
MINNERQGRKRSWPISRLYAVTGLKTPTETTTELQSELSRFQPRLESVKVKLSLCLTKHYAMKTYWGNGDIATLIPDLGTSAGGHLHDTAALPPGKYPLVLIE